MGPNSQVAELACFYDRDISPIAKGNMAEHINNFFFLPGMMTIVLGIEIMM